MTPSQPLPPQVLDELARGRMIEAIKLLREARGLELKAAKEAIDAHLRGAPLPPPRAAGPFNGSLPAPVREALQRGNKIEAIRLLREHSGLGLKEAKQAVDAADTGLRAPVGALSPGEVPRASPLWLWLVIAAAAVGALAFYLQRAA
jgi:hypothetical protein